MGVTAHTRLLRDLPRLVDFGDVDFCGVRVGGQPNPMFRTFVLTSSHSFAHSVIVDIMGALMIAWTVRLASGMPLMPNSLDRTGLGRYDVDHVQAILASRSPHS